LKYLKTGCSLAALLAVSTGCAKRDNRPIPYANVAPPLLAPFPDALVRAPPPEVVAELQLSPFYTQYLAEGEAVIVASSRVADIALLETAYLVRQMIGPRRDLLRGMRGGHVRLVVMAKTEMTTDVPEYADMTPKAYWDRRARGLGATPERPATSSGEENLLDLAGDPYAAENIFVHEFAHTVHQFGMAAIDPSFDGRLQSAYNHAKQNSLWAGTYASENYYEYWAEAAQSWFDCNRVNDAVHGPIDTRDKVKAYDPMIAQLLLKVFGDRPWRYQKPNMRLATERTHFANFNHAAAGSFKWPPEAAQPAFGDLQIVPLSTLPRSTPRVQTPATTIKIVNGRPSSISFWWVDFDGIQKHYADIAPGSGYTQSTYAGHVWNVTDGQTKLGGFVAPSQPGEVHVW
jgi:hypothetical protein